MAGVFEIWESMAMDLKTLSRMPDTEWPAEAGRYVLGVLRDGSAGDAARLVAARLAASLAMINDDLVEELLSILDRGDFSDELRGQAAVSLGPALEQSDIGAFGGPRDLPISEGALRQIKTAFRTNYRDGGVPKNVRRRVLEASVRASEDWHHDAIKAAYAHRDRDWRITGVFAMRWVDGFEASILEALQSDDDGIRHEAVRAAGNWGIDAAWSYVQPILSFNDTDKKVLLAAIEAVASIRPNEAAAVLSDFTDDEDDDIVEAAQDALLMAEAQLRGDDDEGAF
jgi:HEAT repeats